MYSKKYPWEEIRLEYETTTTPVKKIAERHGVDEKYLHRVARKNGWVRPRLAGDPTGVDPHPARDVIAAVNGLSSPAPNRHHALDADLKRLGLIAKATLSQLQADAKQRHQAQARRIAEVGLIFLDRVNDWVNGGEAEAAAALRKLVPTDRDSVAGTMKVAIGAIEKAIELERLSLGIVPAPTNVTQINASGDVTVTQSQVEDLEPDHLLELRELAEKIKRNRRPQIDG